MNWSEAIPLLAMFMAWAEWRTWKLEKRVAWLEAMVDQPP